MWRNLVKVMRTMLRMLQIWSRLLWTLVVPESTLLVKRCMGRWGRGSPWILQLMKQGGILQGKEKKKKKQKSVEVDSDESDTNSDSTTNTKEKKKHDTSSKKMKKKKKKSREDMDASKKKNTVFEKKSGKKDDREPVRHSCRINK